MNEYSAARILRDGYALACSFPDCPTGTKRALQAAAEHAEATEKPVVDNSVWASEPHFTDLPKATPYAS